MVCTWHSTVYKGRLYANGLSQTSLRHFSANPKYTERTFPPNIQHLHNRDVPFKLRIPKCTAWIMALEHIDYIDRDCMSDRFVLPSKIPSRNAISTITSSRIYPRPPYTPTHDPLPAHTTSSRVQHQRRTLSPLGIHQPQPHL
jgi:hypothetical protein